MPNIKNNQTSFNEVLTLIHKAKRKAYQQANTTVMEHYWDLGKYISDKTTKENWGKGVVKELATYIKNQDPTLTSYGDRNLWRMKQFYETYREAPKLSTLWSQLNWSNNRTIFSRCKTKE